MLQHDYATVAHQPGVRSIESTGVRSQRLKWTGRAHAEPGTEWLKENRWAIAVFTDDRQHMGRCDMTSGHLLLVALVHAINELTVPLSVGVKIGSESAAYKRIDDIAAAEEELEVEEFEQQRQDVLSANSLKAIDRAVPIFIEFFVPP